MRNVFVFVFMSLVFSFVWFLYFCGIKPHCLNLCCCDLLFPFLPLEHIFIFMYLVTSPYNHEENTNYKTFLSYLSSDLHQIQNLFSIIFAFVCSAFSTFSPARCCRWEIRHQTNISRALTRAKEFVNRVYPTKPTNKDLVVSPFLHASPSGSAYGAYYSIPARSPKASKVAEVPSRFPISDGECGRVQP